MHTEAGSETHTDIRDAKVFSRVGMWLFILSEILIFGGLFLLYAMYRAKHPADFHAGSMELSRFDGTLNTIILLTSSLTAALAVFATQAQNKAKLTAWYLRATIACGLGFLVVKTFEWGAKFEHGLYPRAAVLDARPHGEILYFGLYFTMTGLHALHMIIGLGIFAWLLWMAWKSRFTPEYHTPLEIGGLYWHFVDIVWIYLFPLLYLIDRHR